MLAQPCGLLPSGVLITIAEMQNEVPLRYLVFYTRYSIQSVDAHFSGLFAQASDAVGGIGDALDALRAMRDGEEK